MDLGLKGLKAVLVGAGRGIGAATAEILAAEGCDVAIGARTEKQVNKTAEALKAHGGKVHSGTVDVTDPEAYKAFIDGAADALGGIDIFICFTSAGGGGADEKSWKNNFEMDLMATVRGVEASTPYLKESDNAAIVAISTTAALEDFMGVQAYNSVKAAVINYASNLAVNLAGDGIRVNTVSPGPIFIERGSWAMIKEHMTPVYENTLKQIPMGRMGTGEEIAKAIAFAASPAVPFMTGTNIVVDGALTKRVQY